MGDKENLSFTLLFQEVYLNVTSNNLRHQSSYSQQKPTFLWEVVQWLKTFLNEMNARMSDLISNKTNAKFPDQERHIGLAFET